MSIEKIAADDHELDRLFLGDLQQSLECLPAEPIGRAEMDIGGVKDLHRTDYRPSDRYRFNRRFPLSCSRSESRNC